LAGLANADSLAVIYQGCGNRKPSFANSKVKLAGEDAKHPIRLGEFKAHV
jgi:hypothetical protein